MQSLAIISKLLTRIARGLAWVSEFYRIRDWPHFVGFTLLGILFVGSLGIKIHSARVMGELLVASCGLLAFTYSFNEVFDSSLNPDGSYRVELVNLVKSVNLSVIPALGGLLLLSRMSTVSLILGLLFVILWTSYSYPVPRLKAIPIVCTIANGIGFSILFLIGFSSLTMISVSSFLFFCVLVMLEIPAQFLHEVEHKQNDEAANIKTTAIRYGARTVFRWGAVALVGVILLIAVMLAQGMINIFAGVTITVFAFSSAALILINCDVSEVQSQTLRARYRQGGIISGALVAFALLFW